MSPHAGQWPGTRDDSLPGYLAASVANCPGRVAVKERHREVTYAQLDEMSNAVATVLQGSGVTTGMRVGIWLSKSIEAIAAIHGTLRCGAAYVPVDPTAPPRRVAHMIADSGLACLLTTQDRADALWQEPGRPVPGLLILVRDAQPARVTAHTTITWDEVQRRGTNSPRVVVPAAADDLAYILYTSGSTGTPKGVMLTHGNARAFVDWAAGEFGLNAGDVIASHAPLHFDLSIFDVFAAAATGGCLALIPDSFQGLGYALVRFVAEQGVTVWYSVPGALRGMTAARNRELLASSRLRVVAFAGETYHRSQLKELRTAVPPQAALYNLYGPTETNVCTFHRITSSDLAEGAAPAPPIGQPCPYAVAVILDGHEPEPGDDGETTGELCIGGVSVMAGYWNDAKGTARALIQPPGFAETYYRTGDIVRRDRSGQYFFVGRRDGMVKIKGHRVELGEVDAALASHPDVAEAACIAVQGSAGESELIAFAVPSPDSGVDAAALRRHCRDFLPRYMVPHEVVLAAALAQTSTGKIDRRALRTAAAQRLAQQSQAGS